MKREELRKVEWFKCDIGKDKHQRYTGYFHMWHQVFDWLDGFQQSALYAVVETEKGNIIYLEPKEIRFIDNDPIDRYEDLIIG